MRLKVSAINEEMINEIKAECLANGIKVNIRKNKQQYAVGGINVTATKANDYRFTKEQCQIIGRILLSKNIDFTSMRMINYIDNVDKMGLFYSQGFNFLNVIEEI